MLYEKVDYSLGIRNFKLFAISEIDFVKNETNFQDL